MQCLIRTGHLKVQGYSKEVANRESPKCAAFEFGNSYCRSNKVNKIKNNPMKNQDLNTDRILSVHMVYADHYILRDPGRLYQTKGK